MQFLSLVSTDPAFNLALEECLLQWLPADHPGLFLLWQNAPSVIVGRHQVTLDEIDSDFVRERRLPVVRRMTGGGAVYHDLGNLNFSFMENAHGRKAVDFARYLRPVCAALADLGVQACLTGRNDLEAGGRKISGSAQSLHRDRILHHGTLLVELDFGDLVRALRVDPDKIRSKGVASVRSRVANIAGFWKPGSSMDGLRAALLRRCADGEARLEPEVLRAAETLAARKYRSWDWNYGASPPFTLQRRERFPWGLVDWRLDVRGGVIRSCRICGDFFATAEVAALEALLCGVRCEPQALAHAVRDVSWQEYFSHCDEARMRAFFTTL
ncbi:lipoate--protein ligase [uncultured Desulfovibrio sp.]|uniref:lipoate--protein ligase n=1 Tax=uncultured Desulfovibrio sp. TaxID=167968 RepID=UPI00260D9987|nr:lipoate--protein ligase [uncultured Desulfovibrio sp.]